MSIESIIVVLSLGLLVLLIILFISIVLLYKINRKNHKDITSVHSLNRGYQMNYPVQFGYYQNYTINKVPDNRSIHPTNQQNPIMNSQIYNINHQTPHIPNYPVINPLNKIQNVNKRLSNDNNHKKDRSN